MTDMQPVEATGAGKRGDAEAEHSDFGADGTNSDKAADGIDGNLADKRQRREIADASDVGVPPEEDPKMGV